jgi:hypothetical protein
MNLGAFSRFALVWTLTLVGCGSGDFTASTDGAGGASHEETLTTGGASTGGVPPLAARGNGGSVASADAGHAGAKSLLCVPGKSDQCAGPGGCFGGQSCNADGSGFGECVCAATGTGGGTSGGGGSGGVAQDAGGGPKYFRTSDGQEWLCGMYELGNRCDCYHSNSVPDGFCDHANCSIGACPELPRQCCAASAIGCLCESGGGTVCSMPDVKSCP